MSTIKHAKYKSIQISSKAKISKKLRLYIKPSIDKSNKTINFSYTFTINLYVYIYGKGFKPGGSRMNK